MTAQQVDLQRAERLARDCGFGQRAEAGVDAVHRRVAQAVAIDDGARRVHGGRGPGMQPDRLTAVGDGNEVVEREVGAGERDHKVAIED